MHKLPATIARETFVFVFCILGPSARTCCCRASACQNHSRMSGRDPEISVLWALRQALPPRPGPPPTANPSPGMCRECSGLNLRVGVSENASSGVKLFRSGRTRELTCVFAFRENDAFSLARVRGSANQLRAFKEARTKARTEAQHSKETRMGGRIRSTSPPKTPLGPVTAPPPLHRATGIAILWGSAELASWVSEIAS